MVKVINLKQDMPNSDYAIHIMEEEIKFAKKENTLALILIHGYGSHGKGGIIKERVREALGQLVKHKVIEDFVPGELWGFTNEKVKSLLDYCPELIGHEQLRIANSGITIVRI